VNEALAKSSRAVVEGIFEIQPVIISCPERDELLKRTLAAFTATDWASHSPMVHIDTSNFARAQRRQEYNSRAALKAALKTGTEFILFMEDDLIFNKSLYHNLCCWLPPRQEDLFLGSLYNPGIREWRRCKKDNYFVAEPDAVYGSQCFLMNRQVAKYLVEHWSEVEGMQDIKISRLIARFAPIYYHTPSLVQHVGTQSVWGGRHHTAADFSEDFAAAPLSEVRV